MSCDVVVVAEIVWREEDMNNRAKKQTEHNNKGSRKGRISATSPSLRKARLLGLKRRTVSVRDA